MIIAPISQMDRLQSQTPHGTRARASVRLALGFAQMFGAVFSATLLLQTGVTAFAVISATVTGALTVASLLLFGAKRSDREGI